MINLYVVHIYRIACCDADCCSMTKPRRQDKMIVRNQLPRLNPPIGRHDLVIWGTNKLQPTSRRDTNHRARALAPRPRDFYPPATIIDFDGLPLLNPTNHVRQR